jgi:hypothetical protein
MHVFYYANQFKNRHIALELQKELEYYHGLRLVNPFYDMQREDIIAIDEAERSHVILPLRTIDSCRQTMLNDLEIISECDGIVCILYDHDVIGSFMETFYASYVLKIPVYLICYDRTIREHLWIRALCWKIFETVEDFKSYVRDNPKEMK